MTQADTWRRLAVKTSGGKDDDINIMFALHNVSRT